MTKKVDTKKVIEDAAKLDRIGNKFDKLNNAIQKKREYEESQQAAKSEARKILKYEMDEMKRRMEELYKETQALKAKEPDKLMRGILADLSKMDAHELEQVKKFIDNDCSFTDPDYDYDYD